MNLSERQRQLLKLILEEYIESADPISSGFLVDKFNLNLSAATIRNEMAKLIQLGFLQKQHVSAGRVPTYISYKLYIDELMDIEEIPLATEVHLKQNLLIQEKEIERVLREAAVSLAKATGYLCVISTEDGGLQSGGAINVLNYKEFFDIKVSKAVLELLDEYDILLEIINEREFDDLDILIGEDFKRAIFYPVGAVVQKIKVAAKNGYITVLGPSRMNYKKTIPAVKYLKEILLQV